MKFAPKTHFRSAANRLAELRNPSPQKVGARQMCNSRSALRRWKTAVNSAACQNRSIRLEKAAACFATQAGNLRFIHSGANYICYRTKGVDRGRWAWLRADRSVG
jgi:hypothetical protein